MIVAAFAKRAWSAVLAPEQAPDQPLDVGRLAQAQSVAQAPLLAPQCPEFTLSEVVIETHSGTVLRQRHDSGRPASDLLEQQQRLEEKFRRLLKSVLTPDKSDELIDLVARLDHLSELSPLASMPASQACGALH